jgi:hypothetical protein
MLGIFLLTYFIPETHKVALFYRLYNARAAATMVHPMPD